MALIPWRNKNLTEPEAQDTPLADLRYEMNRLFDNFLREPFEWAERTIGSLGPWQPAVDLVETDEEVVVRAEVPGLKPDDIDVTITGDQLVLSGEKKETEQRSVKGASWTESRSGAFRRAIRLPVAVQADKVAATHEHGVLTIRLPKVPGAVPKRIPVKVGAN
ncbi:MAG: Hsp20/alpha crystallin family protein [Pirellulales bacterium]|nr:Hsp20/alpha crystallin family protein [Pirellulales bacterium]